MTNPIAPQQADTTTAETEAPAAVIQRAPANRIKKADREAAHTGGLDRATARRLFNDGLAAFEAGHANSYCPYPALTNERNAWLAGWWLRYGKDGR